MPAAPHPGATAAGWTTSGTRGSGALGRCAMLCETCASTVFGLLPLLRVETAPITKLAQPPESPPTGLYEAGCHCMWHPVHGLGDADAPSRPLSADLSLERGPLDRRCKHRLDAATTTSALSRPKCVELNGGHNDTHVAYAYAARGSSQTTQLLSSSATPTDYLRILTRLLIEQITSCIWL